MARFAIRNPYFIVVVCLVICIVGLAAVARMPVDLFPPINIPQVVVATFYNGMPPEEIETEITGRFERFFTLGSGIDHIESRSLPGVSIIKVFFQPGTNPDSDVNTISNLAMADLRRLPPGTLPPVVMKFDASSLPVCLIALKGEGLDEAALRDAGQFSVRDQLATAPGASIPPPFGGKYRQIMVYVDPLKLDSYGLSPMDVVRSVNNANLILPAGDAKVGPYDYNIYTNSQIADVADIDNLPLRTENGAYVRVGDVGQAKDASTIQTNVVRIDGQRSVYLPIMKQGGDTNTIAVVNSVKSIISHLTDVPASLKAKVVFDQSAFVKKAIETVLHEGGMGLLLTGLMVLLFLGSLRATAGVFLSIPISALMTLMLLYYFGHGSINSMVLAGLAIVFSRLIDNSVIVLENIFRHLEMGEAPAAAAEKGGEEVTLAVLAATLTSAIVFFPVTFLYGVSRFLFTALAVTVVLALVASFFVAVTVVPLFCAKYLKGKFMADPEEYSGDPEDQVCILPTPEEPDPKSFHSRFNAAFNRLLDWYERKVTGAIRRPGVTLAAFALIFAISLSLFPLLGVAFFPRSDAGQFVINLRAPTGTRVERTEALVAQAEGIIRRVVAPADLKLILSNIGVIPGFSSIYTSNSGPDTATIQVALNDGHKTGSYEYMDRVRAAMARQLPQVATFFQSGSLQDAVLNQGLPAPIDVQVSGNNLDDADNVALDLARKFRAVPGVSDVFIPQALDYPALRLDVDRLRADELGLDQKEVIDNVITSLTSNGMIAPSYWIDPKTGNDYMLTVQYPEKEIQSVADLTGIPLHSPELKRPTLLDTVASVERIDSPTEVDHYNIRRIIDVYVNPAGEDLGRVAAAVDRIKNGTSLPPGVEVNMRGMVQGMRASFRSFGFGLILAIVLLYLILVAQFRSYIDPLIILLAVPPGVSGVLAILYLTGTTLNVQSLMGVVMMVGMTVSNSILIVEFAHHLESEGLTPAEAVSRSCRIRLRPILMTSLATVFGLIPMAMKLSEGSEVYAPLARAIIGGLLASVAITIFIVPAAYLIAYGGDNPPGNDVRVNLAISKPIAMLLILIGLSCGAARADALPAAQPPALTLKQAEQIALANHPRLKADIFVARAGAEATKEIESTEAPQVYGEMTAVGASPGSRILAGGLSNPQIYDRYANGVAVSQLITDFGHTRALVKSSADRENALRDAADETRLSVLYDADQAYYGVLQAKALLKVAEETVSERKAVFDLVDALEKSKLKSGLDVSFAEVNLDQGKLLLIQARNNVDAAYTTLSTALGYDKTIRFALTDTVPPAVLPAALSHYRDMAFLSRPDLLAAGEVVKSARWSVEAARTLSLPTVSAAADAGESPAHVAQLNPTYGVIGVNVSIPIFNGGLFAHEEKQAKFVESAQQQAYLDLKNQIAHDVETSWLDANSVYNNLEVTTRLRKEAAEALDLAQARYNLGLGSIVELSQAQLNLTQAEIDQTTAEYQYQMQLNNLLYQTGVHP